MAEAIEGSVVVNGVDFPCFISTNLGDVDFLKSVMLGWGQWPDGVVRRHLNNSVELDELEEFNLRHYGYFVAEGESRDTGVILVKADSGKWVVLGYNFEQLEEFVEALEQGVDQETNKKDDKNAFWFYFLLSVVGIVAILALALTVFYTVLGMIGLMGDNSPMCIFAHTACFKGELWLIGATGAGVLSAMLVGLFVGLFENRPQN